MRQEVKPEMLRLLREGVLSNATENVSVHLFGLKPADPEKAWDMLKGNHPRFADKITDLQRLDAVVEEITAVYPRVDEIAKGLIHSYPHSFGVENFMTKLILSRVGIEEITRHAQPGQWTISQPLLREYFQIREELGKGKERRGITGGEIVRAVLTGRVPIQKGS